MATHRHWLPQEYEHELDFRSKCISFRGFVRIRFKIDKRLSDIDFLENWLDIRRYVAALCEGIQPADEFKALCADIPGLDNLAKNHMTSLIKVSDDVCEKLLSGGALSQAEAEQISRQVVVSHHSEAARRPDGTVQLMSSLAFPNIRADSPPCYKNIDQNSDQEPLQVTDNQSKRVRSAALRGETCSKEEQSQSVLSLLQAGLRAACGPRNALKAKLVALKQEAANDPSYEELWLRARSIARKLIIHFHKNSVNSAARSQAHRRILGSTRVMDDVIKRDISVCGNVLAMMAPKNEAVRKLARSWSQNEEALNRRARRTVFEQQFKTAHAEVGRAFDAVTRELVRLGEATTANFESHREVQQRVAREALS